MSKIKLYLGTMFILGIAVNLSACSMYSNKFDGKFEKGVQGKSISEVNDMIDAEESKNIVDNKIKIKPLCLSQREVCTPIIMGGDGMIQRMNEEHLKIWIAPFEDEQGNFHEASVVHTVIKPGAWQSLEKS